MADLSIVIPARNEMFLGITIENILTNIEGDTEIIAVMDGEWPDPGIPINSRVKILRYPQSVGQRAATNGGVRLSNAKYIMKCDAHCSFDKGFDVKMMQDMHDDWTMVPNMKNLHAFDWVCPDGHRRYQGPSGPCTICGKPTTRDIIWQGKPSPNSTSYCFDSTPHFQYFGDFKKRPEGKGDITETMSLQGSCWMLTRDKYWELNICDENFGSWGSQGIEVAVKTWLSGGRVVCNHKTWYAHMFRTQGGDFGFPYPIKGSDQEKAKMFARDLFFNNKWPLQKKPLSWLIEKFWPVPGWTREDLNRLKNNTFEFSENPKSASGEIEPTEDDHSERIIFNSNKDQNDGKKYSKGILFYTDHAMNIRESKEIQNNLLTISQEKGIPIVNVSIKPMPDFGTNICLPELVNDNKKDIKQILTGLKNINAETVYICEKDIDYPPSHFDLNPTDENAVYFGRNAKGREYGFYGSKTALINYFERL